MRPPPNRTRSLRTVPGQPLTPDRIKENKIAKTDNEVFFGGYSYRERRIADKRQYFVLEYKAKYADNGAHHRYARAVTLRKILL